MLLAEHIVFRAVVITEY